jgi:hypothetical protein
VGSGMPWWKCETGVRRNPKVLHFASLMGDRRDKAWWGDLLDYCAEEKQDGEFPGPDAGRTIEVVLDYRGPKGKLSDCFLRAGLLDLHPDGTLEVHNWKKKQKPLYDKFLRDRQRSQEKSRDNRATIAGGIARQSRDPLSPLSISVSSVSKISEGGAGETNATTAEYPPSLRDRLEAEYRTARGHKYLWDNRKDEPAIARLLSHAEGDEDEIVRRWVIGLGWRDFPTCGTLAELAQQQCWVRYDRPWEPKRGRPSRVYQGAQDKSDFEPVEYSPEEKARLAAKLEALNARNRRAQ